MTTDVLTDWADRPARFTLEWWITGNWLNYGLRAPLTLSNLAPEILFWIEARYSAILSLALVPFLEGGKIEDS